MESRTTPPPFSELAVYQSPGGTLQEPVTSSSYYATSSSTVGTGGRGGGDKRRHPPSSNQRSPSSASLSSNPRFAATQQHFPRRLHELLDMATTEGFDHIISWKLNGYQFNIHDRQKFADLILPRYFNGIKYKSFLKQLNLYSVRRIASGIDRGAYHHPCMIRGNPDLCDYVTRIPEIAGGEPSTNTPPKQGDPHTTSSAGAADCQTSDLNATSPTSKTVPSFLKKNDGSSCHHHHHHHHHHHQKKEQQQSSVSSLFDDINLRNTASQEEDVIEPTSLEELWLRATRNLAIGPRSNRSSRMATIQMPSEDITEEIVATFLHKSSSSSA